MRILTICVKACAAPDCLNSDDRRKAAMSVSWRLGERADQPDDDRGFL